MWNRPRIGRVSNDHCATMSRLSCSFSFMRSLAVSAVERLALRRACLGPSGPRLRRIALDARTPGAAQVRRHRSCSCLFPGARPNSPTTGVDSAARSAYCIRTASTCVPAWNTTSASSAIDVGRRRPAGRTAGRAAAPRPSRTPDRAPAAPAPSRSGSWRPRPACAAARGPPGSARAAPRGSATRPRSTRRSWPTRVRARATPPLLPAR